ncbi:MAG: oligosaccharide repeat unit polymerase [Prevotellaceae bacterium]|nr:oligosaccharide repeat unit polymerase [Prevotellaceae bacterium]
MIEIITISLLAILIVAYYNLGRNISRPTVLYVSGFLICSCVALCWKEEWGLNKMSSMTAFIIIGGALTFFGIELWDYKKHERLFTQIKLNTINYNCKPISNKKLILFFFFQLFAYAMFAAAKKKYVGTDSLSEALVEINNEKKFEHTFVQLPYYIVNLYFICMAAYQLWSILLPYYIFKSKKYNSQKILLTLNFVTTIIGTLLSGGRTDMLYGLLSFFTFLYINYQYKIGWKGGLFPRKITITILSIGFIFILCFAEIGYAIGRKQSDTTQATSMLFAIYCGAEIKNLDDYIQQPFKQGNETDLFAQYTLCGMYDRLIERRGAEKEIVKRFSPDLSFNRHGVYPLGNVYTTYYNFILDFGYIGAILCTGLMAFIASFFYRKVITSKFWHNGRLDLWMLFFASYMPAACFLSFFSNKFFESFTIHKTIKQLIVWWLLILVFQGRNKVHSSSKK